jgi:hypothetical protein
MKDAKKIRMGKYKYLGHHDKTKPMNYGYRRRGDTN